MRRIFVVGFPRSGTTLLQSVLMSRFNLVSFTESHYYERKVFCPLELFDVDVRICDSLYLPRLNGKEKKIGQFLKENHIDCKVADKFPIILDKAANNAGAEGWVEKTPGHIRRIPLIRKDCEDAIFIHIVRRFEPVFDSWKKASKYTNAFDAKKDKIRRKWARDVQRSLSCCTQGKRHYLISYESLVNRSNEFVSKISTDLRLSKKEEGLIDGKAVEKIIRDDEEWKKNNFSSGFLELKENDTKVTSGYEESLYQQIKSLEKSFLV